MKLTAFLTTVLVGGAAAQQPGHQKKDGYPPLTVGYCTKAGGCTTKTQSIVIDSNWDWVHKAGDYTNCYKGNAWDKTDCPDGKTCAKNCALDAGTVADYESTYGISTSGNALTLKFVTMTPPSEAETNSGSRRTLMGHKQKKPVAAAAFRGFEAVEAEGAACCSWDKCGHCGNTTAYCKASQSNCEKDCTGVWCPNGAGGGPAPGPSPGPSPGPAGNVGNVGSRTYLMSEDGETYEMFKLKNKEFTFDVDVSQLVCGLNGALYFVAMDADGGLAKYPGNKAGAKYGTGYCDAQCPQDIKFINGEANIEGWSATGASVGKGRYGTCCTEMDIWEANNKAQAYTPHTCTTEGQHRCDSTGGTECGGDGVCDKSGCDINPYRMGVKDFFGEGSSFTLDSSKPMTVVTQFLTGDGTDTGDLTEIRRLYVQDGKVIKSPSFEVGGKTYDSISDEYCSAEAKEFADNTAHTEKNGGLKKMGEDMDKGMVLVLSLWDDAVTKMQWLDSDFPPTDAGKPGYNRGPCATTEGDPDDLVKNHADATVKYSNIKLGEIGSTYSGGSGPTPAPPSPSPTPSGCPGGSLSACIGSCPSDPPVAYKACIQECVKRCS